MKFKPLIRPAVIILFFAELSLSILAECKDLYVPAELGRSDTSQNIEEDTGIFLVDESATAMGLVIGEYTNVHNNPVIVHFPHSGAWG